MTAGGGVRDVARRAVQAEIRSVAERLFREQGYDATTVDQIAERIGMSQRTFFRHAGSKEDLVLSDSVAQGERMVELLLGGPEGEGAWALLRRAFEVFVGLQGRPEDREHAKLMRSIVESSPTLRAANLERVEALQRRMTDVLVARGANGESRAVLRAVVGAAFAVLYAVTEDCDSSGRSGDSKAFAAELDHVMDRLRPHVVRE